MVASYWIITSAVISLVSASATSYQYVKFIKPTNNASKKLTGVPKFSASRVQRSFQHFPTELIDLPDDWPTEILFPETKICEFTFGRHPHISPDFTNGLEHPDPYLLTGQAARRAVAYVYGKGELFFHQIPHVRQILKLQEVRKRNGLPPNRLGSLRRHSPFCRFACSYYA